MGDSKNRVVVELSVDGEGHVTAVMRGAGDEAERLAHRTNEVGASGLKLREVFSGTLLADFFRAGLQAAAEFSAESVRAAAEAEKAQRYIFNSATSAKVALDAQFVSAEKLRKELGLSRVEAQGGLAGAIQLSSSVGRPQDAELFFKRLADLRASRGVSTDITELQRQLFTSDEGTDKLFGKNPSTIHAEYAATLGTVAEKLSDAQKNQAIWNAVVTEGEKVVGAASGAVQTQAGRVDLLAGRWTDFKSVLGDAVLENGLFNDSISATIRLLEGATEAQSKYTYRSLEEARIRALNAPGSEFEAGVTDPLQKLAEVYLVGGFKLTGLALKDIATLTPRDQSEAVATAQLLQDRLKEIDEDRALNAESRQVAINNAVLQAEARQGRWVGGRRLSDAELEQKRQSEQEATNAASIRRSEQLTQFGDDLTGALSEENLTARTEKLRALREEVSKVFDGAEVEKQTKKIDAALEKTQKEIEQTIRTARDAFEDFLGNAATRIDSGNPFTGLFIRFDQEIEETRKKFAPFGEAFVEQAVRIQKEVQATELATARLQSSLQVLKYEQEARRLERPFVGLTGPEERALATVGARIGGAVQGTAGTALAEALRAGRTNVPPAVLARRQFDELLKLEGSLTGLDGRGAEAARDALDAQFKALYSGLDEKTKAGALQYAPARDRFSGGLRARRAAGRAGHPRRGRARAGRGFHSAGRARAARGHSGERGHRPPEGAGVPVRRGRALG